jgi:hypothetical protein
MNDSLGLGLQDFGRQPGNPGEPYKRAVGSPLPVGGGGSAPVKEERQEGPAQRPAPPVGRSLTTAPEAAESSQPLSGFQRAVGALRLAMPFVQRILPLLDGNVATTVSNILSPHAAQPVPMNLAPIEDGLAELQAGHRDLRDQVMEQNSSLKRVEDQLEMVREATDRNTLEQQELLEDLKAVSNKVNTFAFIALVLLALSVVLNIILYLHIRRVLP